MPSVLSGSSLVTKQLMFLKLGGIKIKFLASIPLNMNESSLSKRCLDDYLKINFISINLSLYNP